MCKLDVDTGGYKLKNGKIVTPDGLEYLGKEELEELLSTNISAWEFLMLRNSNHKLVNAINSLTGSMQEKINVSEHNFESISLTLKSIEESLIVETENGIKQKRKIADVVVEMWNFHKPERNKKDLKKLVFTYRIPLIIILITSLALSIKFHNAINDLMQGIENWVLLTASSALILSAIGYIVKMIIEKKNT